MLRWLIIPLLLLTCLARAEEDRSPAAVEARDEEVGARAKHRQYPGGVDESEIKVQSPLPTPVRKIAPTLDESEAGADD